MKMLRHLKNLKRFTEIKLNKWQKNCFVLVRLEKNGSLSIRSERIARWTMEYKKNHRPPRYQTDSPPLAQLI